VTTPGPNPHRIGACPECGAYRSDGRPPYLHHDQCTRAGDLQLDRWLTEMATGDHGGPAIGDDTPDPPRACQCTCAAWGHPGACDGRDVCTITAEPRNPDLDLWPAANVGEFRLCPPCLRALNELIIRVAGWEMNIEAFGYPTIGMLEQAEIDRLTGHRP
jgi:hypothetical protein